MLVTLICIGAVLLVGFVIGLPIVWLARDEAHVEEADWLLAPFLGLSISILILHNLTYFNFTVSRCTPWIWGLAGALWLFLLWKRGCRRLLARCPWPILLLSVAVYGVHGLGLIRVGLDSYYGYKNADLYNYTSLAQFFADKPFSTTLETLGQRPDLVDGIKLKDDRIGAMILQAFFASSVQMDAMTLFEPMILLGPALIVISLFLISRKLAIETRYALALSAAGGLVPGIANLQLNSFLSHTLGIPFLFCFLPVVQDAITSPDRRNVLYASVIAAGLTSLYTEFFPIVVGLIVITALGATILRLVRPAMVLVLVIEILALTVGLNPFYNASLLNITRRVDYPTTTLNVYEAFYNPRGLGTLWISDFYAYEPGRFRQLTFVISIILTVLALLGLLRLAYQGLSFLSRSTWIQQDQRKMCLLRATILAVAVLPLAVFLKDDKHPYQIIKLAFTVSPLLVLGIACLGPQVASMPGSGPETRTHLFRLWRRAAWAMLLFVVALSCLGTGSMARRVASLPYMVAASKQYMHVWAWKGYTPILPIVPVGAWNEALQKLRSLHGEDVVLACGPGVYLNCWPAYAARQNRVWIVNPELNIPPFPLGQQLTDLSIVPHDAFVMSCSVTGSQIIIEGDYKLVWTNKVFHLWRLGPGPYTLRPGEASSRPDADLSAQNERFEEATRRAVAQFSKD